MFQIIFYWRIRIANKVDWTHHHLLHMIIPYSNWKQNGQTDHSAPSQSLTYFNGIISKIFRILARVHFPACSENSMKKQLASYVANKAFTARREDIIFFYIITAVAYRERHRFGLLEVQPVFEILAGGGPDWAGIPAVLYHRAHTARGQDQAYSKETRFTKKSLI